MCTIPSSSRLTALSGRLLTTSEICDVLQVGRVALWRWRELGMPYAPLGTRCIRYNLSEVLSWLYERKRLAGQVSLFEEGCEDDA
jgi:predicted DNA-binding transcriptional regulator AlpA